MLILFVLCFNFVYRERTPEGGCTPVPDDDSDISDGEMIYSKFGSVSCVDESTDDASETEEAMAALDSRTPSQSARSLAATVTSATKSAASVDTSVTLTASSPALSHGSPASHERSPLADVSK